METWRDCFYLLPEEMTDIIAWAVVLALGLAICQDAICSILYYLKNKSENWHYNHATRLMRLGTGIFLMVISILKLMGLPDIILLIK